MQLPASQGCHRKRTETNLHNFQIHITSFLKVLFLSLHIFLTSDNSTSLVKTAHLENYPFFFFYFLSLFVKRRELKTIKLKSLGQSIFFSLRGGLQNHVPKLNSSFMASMCSLFSIFIFRSFFKTYLSKGIREREKEREQVEKQ